MPICERSDDVRVRLCVLKGLVPSCAQSLTHSSSRDSMEPWAEESHPLGPSLSQKPGPLPSPAGRSVGDSRYTHTHKQALTLTHMLTHMLTQTHSSISRASLGSQCSGHSCGDTNANSPPYHSSPPKSSPSPAPLSEKARL